MLEFLNLKTCFVDKKWGFSPQNFDEIGFHRFTGFLRCETQIIYTNLRLRPKLDRLYRMPPLTIKN
jgi:hypothetical protein